jgi:death-on-curing family protein
MLITINEGLINIIHYYVVTKLAADEGIVYSGTITGCVDKVFSPLYGQKMYMEVEEKAGAILYSIVHGHSFTDGNKRTGLLVTSLFLYFNGMFLKTPPDCASFLERMADAQNPKAPTEVDAINWVKKNSSRSLFGAILNIVYTFYCRSQGMGFLEQVTPIILSRNIIPYVDQETLVDRKLLELRRQRWKKRVTCNNEDSDSE